MQHPQVMTEDSDIRTEVLKHVAEETADALESRRLPHPRTGLSKEKYEKTKKTVERDQENGL